MEYWKDGSGVECSDAPNFNPKKEISYNMGMRKNEGRGRDERCNEEEHTVLTEE